MVAVEGTRAVSRKEGRRKGGRTTREVGDDEQEGV